MKQRCQNPRDAKYRWYGGRGIQVRFPSWVQFRDWSLSHGYEEGLTIDRIDNDGHYEPSNCRWVTHAEQARNKSNTVTLTAFGETKPLIDWVEDPRCTVGYTALIQRLRKSDWTPEDMVTRPPVGNQWALVVPGQRDACPDGHDLSQTRVWNKRGDYYCRECKNAKARARYRASKKGKSA